MEPTRTNWTVVTGGPSAGKTSVVEHLSFLGYKVIAEAARILMHDEISRGKTVDEIRSDNRSFQSRILNMKIDLEDRLDPDELLFLDRGIPDSIAYDKVDDLDPQPAIEASKKRLYKAVFILEPLAPGNPDLLARRGDAHRQLKQWDQAIADCSEAIRLNPTNWYAHFVRAEVYRQLTDWNRAIADFSEAIRRFFTCSL